MLTSHHSLKYKPKKSLKFRHQLHEHEFYTSCWNLNTRHSIGDYSISVWNISSVYIYTLRGQTAQPIHWETSHVETNLQDQTHSSNQPLFTIYNDTKIQESAVLKLTITWHRVKKFITKIKSLIKRRNTITRQSVGSEECKGAIIKGIIYWVRPATNQQICLLPGLR